MSYIVTDIHGQPMKLSGHKFAVAELAMPSERHEATRFESVSAATAEAHRMANLGQFTVEPLNTETNYDSACARVSKAQIALGDALIELDMALAERMQAVYQMDKQLRQ